MTWHTFAAKALANQRGIIAALTSILGVLVGFNVLQVSNEQAILGVVGIVFAWLGGSAYVQGKHVEAAALLASKAPTPSAMTPTGGQAG